MNSYYHKCTIIRLATMLGIIVLLLAQLVAPALTAPALAQPIIAGSGSNSAIATRAVHGTTLAVDNARSLAAGESCKLPYAPGEHSLTLQSGGLERTVVICVPSGSGAT